MWTRRNEKRNDKKFLSGLLLVQWVRQHLSEFQSANVKLPLENETSSHAWIQPSAPLFKVNVDGAIFFFFSTCVVWVL